MLRRKVRYELDVRAFEKQSRDFQRPARRVHRVNLSYVKRTMSKVLERLAGPVKPNRLLYSAYLSQQLSLDCARFLMQKSPGHKAFFLCIAD